MTTRRLRWLLDHVLRRRAADRELNEEIRGHLALDAQQRIEAGDSPEDAWRAARRQFGNELLVREVTRDTWGFTSCERIAQDVRYAVRSLRRSPAFAMIACAALALGIGATTMIFTVVHSVLLRPLPFPQPDRLVMIWERNPATGRRNPAWLDNFVAWRERSRSFEAMAAYHEMPMNLIGGDEPVQVTGAAVTAEFFHVLGITPLVGRTFDANEDAANAPPTVVLSHAFWLQRFAGRRDVIGQRVSINVTHHEVIGVLPAGFAFPHGRVQAFVPLRINRAGGRNHSVVARLRPDVGPAAAGDEIAAIAAQTAAERPQMNAKWSAMVVPLHEQIVGET